MENGHDKCAECVISTPYLPRLCLCQALLIDHNTFQPSQNPDSLLTNVIKSNVIKSLFTIILLGWKLRPGEARGLAQDHMAIRDKARLRSRLSLLLVQSFAYHRPSANSGSMFCK